MKLLILVTLTAFLLVEDSAQLPNLMNTPTHNCIQCLCHARTGCFSRMNCASYSINFDYWKEAGSPTIDPNDPDNQESYQSCMRNENCILNTIKLFTDGFGQPRCDCNDIYDCRDMLMLHLHGEKCTQTVDPMYSSRYNNCARMNNLTIINAGTRCIPDTQ